MSADDQRAAAVERAMKLQAGTVLAREVDRLRAELAETRRQLAIAHDAEYSRCDAFRTAGDALADSVESDKEGGYGEISYRTDDAVAAWRSVRGGAPAEPPADGEDDDLYDLFPDEQRLDDWAEQTGVDLHAKWRHDGVLYARDYAGRQYMVPGESWPVPVSAPTASPAEPPAVELPVTLSSVDDETVEYRVRHLQREDSVMSDDVANLPEMKRMYRVALAQGEAVVESRTVSPWRELPAVEGEPAIEAARGGSR